MPPGARPHPLGYGATAPKQMHQTAAIASGGRAAIDAQRQAADYGATGQRQALEDLYNQISQGQPGYTSHPDDTSAYAQWQQAQGFRPTNYPVAYGAPTPQGKFAGYKTEVDLRAHITGAAELAREHDLEQAAQLKGLMDQKFGDLGQQYDQSQAPLIGSQVASLAGLGNARNDYSAPHGRLGITNPTALESANAMTGVNQAQNFVDVTKSRADQNQGRLNDWYQQQGQPLVEGLQTADQIQQTPTREYQFRAGAQAGVDPSLLAGWFPMSGQIQDAANQRDLTSLDETGLPYQEQQSTLQGLARDTAQQSAQSAADDKLAMSDDIYNATVYPGTDLADAASLPIEVVHDLTTSPNFQGYAANVENALNVATEDAQANHALTTEGAKSDAIQQAVDDAIAQAADQAASDSGDQNVGVALKRILSALYHA